ncbi:hypothetical protein EZV62_007054 [Acer yangbiense]|uniref:Leucine-rich repeat-containing N-terminal plant-type domain-containing protein n=1 Tax=Acer yangbiense TaxID=1000413 RepID=A0A5C7IAL2_9ROSI|nr:hypothetical protein EZV62_007054 [Acer yangbiense]
MLSEYSFSSRLVVMWGALFLYIFVAESELSAKEFEREALLNTSWWNNGVINNTSDHCKWVGIVCNSAGTIIGINLFNRKIKGELRELNFSCFPNLESLSLGELLVLLAIVIIIFFDRDGQISLGKGFSAIWMIVKSIFVDDNSVSLLYLDFLELIV